MRADAPRAADWAMESRSPNLIVLERLLEAAREIGTLLIAFAPLDFAMGTSLAGHPWPYLAGFLIVGFVLLGSSIIVEWRLKEWRRSS